MRLAFGIVMLALLVATGSIGLTFSAGYVHAQQVNGTPVPPIDGPRRVSWRDALASLWIANDSTISSTPPSSR